ncbi:hypothetical protein ABID50_000771 [Streptococcus parasuis]|uniref:Uncharacterized protein n=1 Tax=Streptococcus parasuis TaxID=1501662 RepID=A0ABV2EQZ9_9STRE
MTVGLIATEIGIRKLIQYNEINIVGIRGLDGFAE